MGGIEKYIEGVHDRKESTRGAVSVLYSAFRVAHSVELGQRAIPACAIVHSVRNGAAH